MNLKSTFDNKIFAWQEMFLKNYDFGKAVKMKFILIIENKQSIQQIAVLYSFLQI